MQLDAKSLCMQIVTGDIWPQFIIFSLEAIVFCAKGFVTKEFLDLHCWMN